MEKKEKICCVAAKHNSNTGVLSGILYGLIPHTFCIAFILFSTIGTVAATVFFKRFLLIPYFFYFLIFISLLLATISSVIYLKRTSCLCISGIKRKWKYITILYSTTILINLFMFFIVIPILVNASSNNTINQENNLANASITVQIPCSGHASLIINELKKDSGVGLITFEMPNIFKIKYDPKKTSPEKIVSLEIFKIYKAIVQ
ncbi:MAG: hypothetical protein WC306_01730 [Candidatus Paceibacterota bacterium]|jgi:hypothetical protein